MSREQRKTKRIFDILTIIEQHEPLTLDELAIHVAKTCWDISFSTLRRDVDVLVAVDRVTYDQQTKIIAVSKMATSV
jgi:predicted DNA-binding transcriptional regulator YafY